MNIPRPGAWALLATLGILALIAMPDLGSGAWPFRPATVDPDGLLGPLVRAADGRVGSRCSAHSRRARRAHGRARGGRRLACRALACAAGAIGLCVLVVSLLAVPASLLQIGLRDATQPWYHVNDSTYQIELAGDLVLDGDNPYGHDYRDSGLERWYPAAGEGGKRQVALDHFAYFPGTS